ncbi:MAG: YceD family protein [Aquificaceae bacterium]
MVVLNLKEIFKNRKRFAQGYTFKPEDIKLPPDLGEIVEPINLYVEITREKGGYMVHMEIEGYVVLQCSRCLTLYNKDIGKVENIRIEAYPTKDVVYLKPGDLNVSFYENEEAFDLTNLLREQIILSIPTKPLCSPHCRGEVENIEKKATTLGDLLKKANML